MSNIENARLVRELGLLEGISLCIGGMIGGTIYSAMGLAAETYGWAIIPAFLINAIIAACVGYSYAKLTLKYPQCGGGYTFVSRAFPNNITLRLVVGILQLFAYVSACSFYALAFGYYLHFLLPFTHHLAYAIMLIIFFAIINLVGVKYSGIAEDFVAYTKVAILSIFVLMGMLYIKLRRIPLDFTIRSYTDIIYSSAMLFLGFEGFEVIANASEELKNPSRDVKIAILASLLIVVSLYSMVALVTIALTRRFGIVYGGETILAELASRMIGFPGKILLSLGALIATTSAFNAALYASSRLLYAISRDGLLPSFLAVIDERRMVPRNAIIISSILTSLLLFTGGKVKELVELAGLNFLVIFLIVSAINIILRRETKSTIIIPAIAIVGILWVILHMALTVWIRFLVCLSSITVISLLTARRLRREH